YQVFTSPTPYLLSNLILDPRHSILTQSYDSRLRLDMRRPHNGDGFGVGYYTPPSLLGLLGPQPCIFTSTIPAWNCTNLERLASKTVSPLVFAHVRASTEGALAEPNCHPFVRGTVMWMHNGGIGCWKDGVKRLLVSDVADKWFNMVKGSTDSEWAFALFLDTLQKLGVDVDELEHNGGHVGVGPTLLRKAMTGTIERINGYIRTLKDRGVKVESSLLNFAVTDGKSVVCTRYVGSRTDEAASLFFSSGSSWVKGADGNTGDYRMERRDRGADIVVVASEPLTFERDNWVTVPTNSTITIHNQTVLIHPILDEYYVASPSFQRSSTFAQAKGQIT
ncbi:N-terminal nucleophile aminohydrolase, partial [Myriangium duriaei CBS 260.36]